MISSGTPGPATIPPSGSGVDGDGSFGAETSKAGVAETSTPAEVVLCGHCGRTASNGLSCIGACVADSGY